MAQQLAGEPWLAFACGRYEGIDERVLADAATRMRVTPVSLGDYVLGGGEVAALVVIEAVTRLLPGVVGNPDSLTEESHADGLLEYPVYTKPASWRGWDVPPVLLSGDHAAIAQWRTAQQLARTAGRRPDLLAVGAGPLDLDLALATPADAGELWTLQRACWLPESQHNPGLLIPALVETLEDVRAGLAQWRTVVGRLDGRLVASARARTNPDDDRTWEIGRLMVAPDLRGRGWGQQLLDLAASWAPPQTERWLVFTGAGSERNQRMYRRAGYRLRPDLPAPAGAVAMTKRHAGPRGS
ncbi:MAG: tRNA (guanine(37)-N(1))-methyltransferase [Micrococcales bacterium]|nr:MAG: tRNA (guanine(37)-N(1))-methyltransferase [Micrococcales bacterium]